MNHELRVAAAATGWVLAIASSLSGCATERASERPISSTTVPQSSPTGLEVSAVNYVNEVCGRPKGQRDPALRSLNQSLVPNHAVI
jgi:hypothetical protein